MSSGDEREENNIKEEQQLSERMLADLKHMMSESRAVAKDYKALLKNNKKLVKIIKAKERDNEDELIRAKAIALDDSDVESAIHKVDEMKKEERKEHILSKEEAQLLTKMLHELNDISEHEKNIAKTNDELNKLVKDTYAKDIEDYELEGRDIQ